MGEEAIRTALKDFGLTVRETDVYIFLSKYGVLKGAEISKRTRTNKAEVYRILKSLQTKGLVEPTLESPIRFTIVPFEKILDSQIKAKKEEAAKIENARKELLIYWKNIGRIEPAPEVEKLMVIEGNQKILARISQMIRETKVKFSTISTVHALSRLEQQGLFENALEHPLENKTQFRFLTEVTKQSANAVRLFLEGKPTSAFNVRTRNPDLGLKLFPRMTIKDEEEILLFMTPSSSSQPQKEEETSLWTNSKSLVQAFSAIFEDLWQNATNVVDKLAEIEIGEVSPKELVIKNDEEATQKYFETVGRARKEILLITSSKGLIHLAENPASINEAAENGASIRIMAPIIDENLEAAKTLARRYQMRHVSTDNMETTIIDGKHLFQIRRMMAGQASSKNVNNADGMSYTDDFAYVNKMKTTLEDVWEHAPLPSFITWEIGLNTSKLRFSQSSSYFSEAEPSTEPHELAGRNESNEIPKSIKDDWTRWNYGKEVATAYATIAQAILQLPSELELPMMGIRVVHYDKRSAFGEGNNLVVFLWLETPPGHCMVPVALLADSPKEAMINQGLLAGTPAAQNATVAKPNQFEVLIKDKLLFAGWTVNIPLPPSKHILAPSSLMFEGHGVGRRLACDYVSPSGFKSKMEFTRFHALATFMNQAYDYISTGIQAKISTDCITKTTPP